MLSGFYCSYPYPSDAPTFAVLPDTRPDCGGILSSATTSQRYASGHIHCGPLPPIPPAPTPTQGGGFAGGRGHRGRKPIQRYVRPRAPEPNEIIEEYQRRVAEYEAERRRLVVETREQEDIMLMLALWVSIKD